MCTRLFKNWNIKKKKKIRVILHSANQTVDFYVANVSLNIQLI